MLVVLHVEDVRPGGLVPFPALEAGVAAHSDWQHPGGFSTVSLIEVGCE